MKIYTKRGDDGTTGLYGGARVSKASHRIESYGTVDELNSVLGVARASAPAPRTDAILDALQHQLFVLGADLATEQTRDTARTVRIGAHDIAMLEQWIDELDGTLPALQQFILPGGAICAAQLHVARTVCRRAERCTVVLARDEQIGTAPVMYLNRLSDLLFVMARYENAQKMVPDVAWNPRETG